MMQFKQLKYIILFICLFASKSSYASLTQEMSPLVEEVGQIIQEKYIIDNIDSKYLKNSAVDGMLRGLDPYSGYYSEEEFNDFQNNTNGKFYGIGVEMKYDLSSDCPIITSVFSGSSAQQAGLLQGDLITHIDDVAIIGKKQDIVSRMIRGKRGTSVKITIYRDATKETFSRTLKRGEVKIPNIISKIYKNKIAIIEIKLFNKQTYTEFVDQLNEIRKKYFITGLVIDLRNNPGGLLESAVDIANLFLQDGQLITSVKGRNDVKVFDYVARNIQKIFENVKIAILINKGSASASEILSGALKDNNRATIVGEQSYGKGLVQEINKLPDEAGLNITIQRYLTPSGTDIHKKGITPDVMVELTKENADAKDDVQLKKAIEILESMTCLVQKNG